MSDPATQDHDGFRTEHDSLGEVQVPAEALWGAQTQRAVENFPISGRTLPTEVIHALGAIKAVAADVNGRLGVIPAEVAAAVAAAARQVAAGRHDDAFPVDVFQTGSGTSSNMNANEVIARLASRDLERPVHPNDHVNASQSSNDVFPSALHVAATRATVEDLVPALDHLADTLRAKADELADVVTVGRTHLMDAVPVTLGQEIGAWATQVARGSDAVGAVIGRLAELPLGGTAVGTGLNCPPAFAGAAVERLAADSGLPFTEATDHMEAQAARDGLVAASGACRGVAVSLTKIANDMRWKASGPRTGLAEIHLPDLQPGSSIMPGKVNPVLAEATTQVAARVMGNDATVAFAGSQGNLELNVYLPVMGEALLDSIRCLAAVSRLLADRCVAGITADEERCRTYAEASPSVVTALNPVVGYERAAAIVKDSLKTGRSIRQILSEDDGLSDEELDRALDVRALAEGGVIGG